MGTVLQGSSDRGTERFHWPLIYRNTHTRDNDTLFCTTPTSHQLVIPEVQAVTCTPVKRKWFQLFNNYRCVSLGYTGGIFIHMLWYLRYYIFKFHYILTPTAHVDFVNLVTRYFLQKKITANFCLFIEIFILFLNVFVFHSIILTFFFNSEKSIWLIE